MKTFREKRLFCLTGLPLSGKSHIGQLLASRVPNATLISTGDIARSLIKSDDQQKEMESKDLFPDETLIRNKLKLAVDSTPFTAVFVDGFPRFGAQATYMADTFWNYFPVVIEINAGSTYTLAIRAKARGRDNRDLDLSQFEKRLDLASKNLSDIYAVLNNRLLTYYTIMSTADESSILKQFETISKRKT